MLRKYALLGLVLLVSAIRMFAQSGGGKSRMADKSDIINFHRQILSLKEYNDERAKIPALQKANKVTVKVKAFVDTTEMATDGEDDDKDKANPKLTGFIRQEIGNEVIDVYQLTFDRVKKKITAVVPVIDSTDNRKSIIATGTKKPVAKKSGKKGDDDEDDDEEEDKSPRKKDADKDED